jgi:hypothetical protein
MKTILQRLVLALVITSSATSCTTAYDAYGNPHQVVDPAAAVVGAAAVGLIAYGLASDNDHHYHNNHYSHGYYNGYSHYNRGYSHHNRGYCRY